jgi:hypothetical protein
MDAAYLNREYLIRRKILTVFGAKFHVYDSTGNLILFSQQKAFKLKEDIRVFSDESKSQERLLIQARTIVDFSAAYDVVDSVQQLKVGALRRKGLRSMLRDQWQFLDPGDSVIASLEEDSMGMAMLRRFLSNLIPQSYNVSAGDELLAVYKQHFNPFVFKLDVRLEPGAPERLDPRLALAGGILLAAVEGRQG